MPRPRTRTPSGTVRLTDPGALRALAHPARLAVVDELYQGHERTSSELARLTGLSPSAMSYHLRALERWGVVERAGPRADGREHPWRAAGRSLSVTDASPASAAAKDVIAGGYLEHLRDELRRWSLVEHDQAGWEDVGSIRRSFLWLTAAEAEELVAELGSLVERYDRPDRDATRHPPGARRLTCLVAVVPGAD